MSWTYSGDPSSSPLDEVRFLIGDTDAASPELQNEEITYQLTIVNGTSPPPASGNFLPAAYAAESIAAKYSRRVDKSVGDLHISYGQLQKQFQAIANRLRSRATIAAVPFYVGGLDLAQKRANDADPNLVSTAVKIDGMDFVGPLNNESGGNLGPD